MKLPEYAENDAVGLAEMVASGEVTPLELVDAAIERIEALDPRLNAVVHRDFERARRLAAGPLPDGPFRGVPFLIKDLACPVEGMPCTHGSRFSSDRPEPGDGPLTRRYREAGLVFLGKTNTPEFGITGTTESTRLGPCRSPWNTERITGGSSGGSAAAVASGMVPAAHASDGLGSIRIPAACCGLFGLKPSRGRNPSGAGPAELALDHVVDHVVTRSVRDSAALLDWTSRHPRLRPGQPAPVEPGAFQAAAGRDPRPLRVAFWGRAPRGDEIDAGIRGGLERTVSLLEELGHRTEERSLPVNLLDFYRCVRKLTTSNAAARHVERVAALGREAAEDDYEPLTWAGIRAGLEVTGEEVMSAGRRLEGLYEEIRGLFDQIDVFVTPVLGTPPPPIGHIDSRGDLKELARRQAAVFPFTPPFNFTGQPAMSVPLWQDELGLPLGIQFVARYGEEQTLLSLAGQLERARPWRERRPVVWG